MGASKFLSEKLALSVNCHNPSGTKISCVRFGNVLGSRGSILPVIWDRIKRGKTVKLYDHKMVRFMMTISQAVSLVLKSMRIMTGGEIYILKMPTVKIEDLINVIIDEFSSRTGKPRNEIIIEITRKRAGERLSENLMTDEEAERAYEYEDLIIIPKEGDEYRPLSIDEHLYKSKYVERLDKEEIRNILMEAL